MAYATNSDATSHDLRRAARNQGFSRTEAEVLSVILFWWQKSGGITRDGLKWQYRSAAEIAAELGCSSRTVQRTLSGLYAKDLLEHRVWHRPGSNLVASFHRPLPAGLAILEAVSSAQKSKGGFGIANLSKSEPPVCPKGNGQIGGSQEQKYEQTKGQKDEKQTCKPAGAGMQSSHAEEKDGPGELNANEWMAGTNIGSSETVAVDEAVSAINEILAARKLPPIFAGNEATKRAVLEFLQSVADEGWPFDAAFKAVLDHWDFILPELPSKFSAYDANYARPSALALGWGAEGILRQLGGIIGAFRVREVIAPLASTIQIEHLAELTATVSKLACNDAGDLEPSEVLRPAPVVLLWGERISLVAELKLSADKAAWLLTAAKRGFKVPPGTGKSAEDQELCSLLLSGISDALVWSAATKHHRRRRLPPYK